jgi:hypothetical protein
LRGAFRTPLGSCLGEIELTGSSACQYFLINPPSQLLRSWHRFCFRSRGNGRYWVHFERPQSDPDAGILALEGLLQKALAKQRKRS